MKKTKLFTILLVLLMALNMWAAPTDAVNGMMPEAFSVGATKVVYFSQGNLQYQASTQTWRFAEHQYDYVGNASLGNVYEGGVKSNNASISDSYTGWIDMFGWSTANSPTTSQDNVALYPTSFIDWGQNAIPNGGNIANRWRTMTYDEWYYLLFQRATTSNVRYAKATVNDVTGLIILPDNWSTSYHALNNANTANVAYTVNNISLATWETDFEAHGAVFLPTAGFRYGIGCQHIGVDCVYWSSTPYSGDNIYDMYVYETSVGMQNHRRSLGCSVRLVCEKYSVTYNGNGNTGGTVPTDNNQYVCQTSVTVQNGTPTKPNFVFAGWLNSVNSQTYAAGNNFAITANTTLTAQWAPAVASITISENTTYYATLSEALSNWVANSTLKLLANVTTSSTITVNNTCTLDLNGYGIKRTGSGAVIAINWGGNLTLNDSNPTTEHHFDVNANNVASLNESSGALTIYGGYITGGSNHYGGAIDVANSGVDYQYGPSLTMNGGTLIGNSGTVGGICVSRDTKDYYNTFTMNGGAICYNDNIGVGVYPQGTFHMNGGIIHHNNGIGIAMWNSKLLTLNNAVITDNNGYGITVDSRRAAIEVQGRTIVSGNNTCDIYYSRSDAGGSRALNIVGTLHSEARIGINNYTYTPNPFTYGLAGRGNASNFFSNDANRGVGLDANNEAHLAPFPTYTTPTGKSGLYYTGEAQALVNAGTVTGGTMNYSLDNTVWSSTIPTGTDAGDYTTYYKVVGDASHADVIPSPNTVEVTISDFQGSGIENDPYLIPSTAVWNHLAAKVNVGNNYASKYFQQTENISVTEPIGNFADNQPANQKPFSGTYDGAGHTLNVNINGSANFAGPFYCLSDATIKNLVVTGSVTSSYRHASGLVGTLMGPCTLENCLVSTSISGTDYMGGLIGHSRLDNFTIDGCVFNGTMTATGNGYTGGFNGWGGEPQTTNATITNCFFAGTYVNSTGGKFHPVGCFGGTNATRTISNVYYTKAPVNMTNEDNISIVKNPVTYKGEFAYSATGGTGVTVAPAGTPTASYDVSGLDFYGENGFALNGVLYGGQGDDVSLNLSAANHAGYSVYDYSTNNGTLTGDDNPYTLTMAAANATINARFSTTKSITATPSASAASGWYLIASPFVSVTPSEENGFLTNLYDLFRFNQSAELEWENWEQTGSHYHFNLEPGRGYLYANSEEVSLTFIGTPYSGNGQVSLSYSTANTDERMRGWNLIGNPFGTTRTIGTAFYRMNTDHNELIAASGDIDPMEGIFVYRDKDDGPESVTFSPSGSKGVESNENNIVINLNDNKGTIIDRAIVSFDESRTLPKFQINEDNTKIYIPQNGKDYAIAFSYKIGELPLNFKANETSVYTLSFSGENMTGVSLVDMIDGAVIDLSVNDTYTFIGTPTDREDRFKLVFNSLNDSNIEIFAYQSGNEIVVSGEGELQVFDVMGRLVMTQYINGVEAVEKPSTTGVYIFRLNEKSQKIVVR